MTLEEIQEIFHKANIRVIARGVPPVYLYYMVQQNGGTGSGSADAKDLTPLVEQLKGYTFHSYTPDTNYPVFVEGK